MTSSNKQCVIDLWKAFSSRDPEQMAELLDEGAVWVAPPDNATAKWLGMPSGMSGRAEITTFIVEQFPRLFVKDVRVDFKGVYADGDIVVVEMVLSASLANNRSYKISYCFVHVVRDGKVIEMREFMDTYNGHRMIFGAEATI